MSRKMKFQVMNITQKDTAKVETDITSRKKEVLFWNG